MVLRKNKKIFVKKKIKENISKVKVEKGKII
jgi:hypothetical protein